MTVLSLGGLAGPTRVSHLGFPDSIVLITRLLSSTLLWTRVPKGFNENIDKCLFSHLASPDCCAGNCEGRAVGSQDYLAAHLLFAYERLTGGYHSTILQLFLFSIISPHHPCPIRSPDSTTSRDTFRMKVRLVREH